MFPARRERIEITIETDESWEMRLFSGVKIRCFCSLCDRVTDFVPAELGRRIIRSDEETFADLVADGSIHSADGGTGAEQMLCLASLKNETETDEESSAVTRRKD